MEGEYVITPTRNNKGAKALIIPFKEVYKKAIGKLLYLSGVHFIYNLKLQSSRTTHLEETQGPLVSYTLCNLILRHLPSTWNVIVNVLQ